MKELMVLLVCAVLLLGLDGCEDANKDVEAVVEGGGRFPGFLVGRWKADEHDWEFVFEADGTVSSALVSIGRVRMTSGQTSTFATRGGGRGVFKPGDWSVAYEPSTRVLEVQIVLDHFYMEMDQDVVEGSSTDMFTGSVSQDGTEWTAAWYSFPKYIVYLGSTSEQRELPVDPNDNPRDYLVFKKVTPEDNGAI